MKDLLEKLTSYNLFNYLLPGIVFVVLAGLMTRYSFVQQDIFIGFFVYYFVGLVISRFGSLVIEPFLKWCSFLRFAECRDFVLASKADKKLDVLSEVNNMYRTLSSLFILLCLLKIYELVEASIPGLKEWGGVAIVVLLLIMFLVAYRKQTAYITKRIAAIKESNKP
jgi:hypothetical protein